MKSTLLSSKLLFLISYWLGFLPTAVQYSTLDKIYMTGVIRNAHASVKDEQISNPIKIWLAHAKERMDREREKKRGRNQRDQVQNEPDDEADEPHESEETEEPEERH